ncbi:MAG: SDR family oxidoreductase [Gammaproteobacteria bacterium]
MKPAKVALITGASRGIGAATARLLASEGYAVAINYRRTEQDALALCREIEQAGGRAIAVQADVADEAEVLRLFDTVTNTLGTPTVLVNNAGILMRQSRLEHIEAERVMEILRVNFLSCFLCCREAVRCMSTRHGGHGGNIVNVSSLAARTGSPNEYVDYAASKAAMDALTHGLANEVAGEGIRVNAVRPGLIYTDMHADGGEAGRVDRLKTRIPLQRGGQAVEVAEAIVWLATEKSSFVTGSFIDVAGGL